MNYELRIMSFKNSYRLQSYDFFCKYANFGVSLQHILVENKKYGNYTHVDIVTKNNKNYLLKNNLNNLRGNQLSAALKESHVSVN